MRPALHSSLADHKLYWVCRVLRNCALTKLESFDQLGTAKKYMRLTAMRYPNSYLIFSEDNGRILARLGKPRS